MTRLIIQSRVGPDGVLHLDVPLGQSEANREVQVIVEPSARPGLTQEEWRDFIQRTAGSWQGPFERPPQGEYEKRDEL